MFCPRAKSLLSELPECCQTVATMLPDKNNMIPDKKTTKKELLVMYARGQNNYCPRCQDVAKMSPDTSYFDPSQKLPPKMIFW